MWGRIGQRERAHARAEGSGSGALGSLEQRSGHLVTVRERLPSKRLTAAVLARFANTGANTERFEVLTDCISCISSLS
jgi:hypothetical protein